MREEGPTHERKGRGGEGREGGKARKRDEGRKKRAIKASTIIISDQTYQNIVTGECQGMDVTFVSLQTLHLRFPLP